MTTTVIRGLIGSGDWTADEAPDNYRKLILYLYPNGKAKLTALLSMMGKEFTDKPKFDWWTEVFPDQGGAITGVYTNALMTSAYTSSGVAGDYLYIKVAQATAQEFRAGHQVVLRDSSDPDVDVNAKVTEVRLDGASSRITVCLLEADDNSATHDLSDADYVYIIGNINPEHGTMPAAINYRSELLYNVTQIFRNALSISRTAQKSQLRNADNYDKIKKQTLEMHSVEMEKAFLFGVPTEGIGSNGKPERTTAGMIYSIRNHGGVTGNFTTDTDYSGKTWLQAGKDWLDATLMEMFKWGSTERLGYIGDAALLGFNKLVETYTDYAISSSVNVYGMSINRYVTPFGEIMLQTHPLFSHQATNSRSLLLFEPSMLRYRYVDDTNFYNQTELESKGYTRVDGRDEEFLTECGLEFGNPKGWAWLNGLGADNTV